MNSILYISLGIFLPFFLSILGSSLVFFFKKNINNKLSALITGFSAGIMIAASIWSLIIPSFSYSSHLKQLKFIPAVAGILIGCLFIILIDLIIKVSKQKSSNKSYNQLTRFVIAFTMHNIPEGLAVGFAFGCALIAQTQTALVGALMLAIGIAIQNFPEGIAISLPVYKATKNKRKSFTVGFLSSVVEPIFALLGLILASHLQTLMPWLLCFSAGAMLFVSIEDLIPDSKLENSHIGTWGFIVGFIIMMTLDVCLT